jgi:hypothetical protein
MSQVKRKAEEDINQEATKKLKLESKEAKRMTSFKRPKRLRLHGDTDLPLEHLAVFVTPNDMPHYGNIDVPQWWVFAAEIWEEIQEATALPGTLSRVIASYASTEGAKMNIWYHTNLLENTVLFDQYAGRLFSLPFENNSVEMLSKRVRWHMESACKRQFWNEEAYRSRKGLRQNAEILIKPRCVHKCMKLTFTVPICKVL